MNKHKKAFTLVELIVVITILAILGTIAFISLQGYSRDARDSVRTSDLSRMKTSLELFQLDAGKYPQVSDESVILYSGATAWTQGNFGDSVFNNVEKLDKIPTDPVNGRKYTYSVTSTRQEYQLVGVMEGGDLASISPLPWGEGLGVRDVNAATKEGTAKITGNYNGKILKVIDGANTYLIAVPSIISADGFDVDYIATNNAFVYNGYKNLPESYSGTSYETLADNGVEFVNESNLLLYSGSTALLSEASIPGDQARIDLMTAMQTAYTGTALASIGEISEILSLSTDEEKKSLATTIVSNDLGGSIVSSGGGSSNEEESTTDSTTTVGAPSLESKTDTTLDLLAGTFTDTDGVQNITVELYSDIGLTNLIGEDADGQFSSLNPSYNYYGVTKGEAYNITNSSWETKRSSGFSVTTNEYILPGPIVSLLGTNNLTSASYTASTTYPGTESYLIPGAFDGYRFEGTTPFLSVPGSRVALGSWTSLQFSNTNQWLSIEFDKPTMVTRFSVYPKTGYTMRMPKNVIIQYSNDGINFTNHESFTLTEGENVDIDLSVPTEYVNHIRLYMLNNQDGVNDYLQLDEFVLNGYTSN